MSASKATALQLHFVCVSIEKTPELWGEKDRRSGGTAPLGSLAHTQGAIRGHVAYLRSRKQLLDAITFMRWAQSPLATLGEQIRVLDVLVDAIRRRGRSLAGAPQRTLPGGRSQRTLTADPPGGRPWRTLPADAPSGRSPRTFPPNVPGERSWRTA